MRSHCALYVDAGYLLAAAATRRTGTSLRGAVNVDHEVIVNWLTEHAVDKSGLPLLRVHWYDSARNGIPDPVQERIALLPGVKVRLGRIGFEGEQKGVDLRIGLDMVAHARNGAVEVMFLVSGDDDLTEAVEEAQAHGVQVTILAIPNEYGRPHGVSRHLQSAADDLDLLAADAVDAAVTPKGVSAGVGMKRVAAAATAQLRPSSLEPPAPEALPAATPEPPTEQETDVPAAEAGQPPTAVLPAVTAQQAPDEPSHVARDVVYSSRTGGLSTIAREYTRTQEDENEIIEGVVDRVLGAWRASANPDQIHDLNAGRPSIPRDIDRALLLDASDALGIYDLSDRIRHELRASFWKRLDLGH